MQCSKNIYVQFYTQGKNIKRKFCSQLIRLLRRVKSALQKYSKMKYIQKKKKAIQTFFGWCNSWIRAYFCECNEIGITGGLLVVHRVCIYAHMHKKYVLFSVDEIIYFGMRNAQHTWAAYFICRQILVCVTIRVFFLSLQAVRMGWVGTFNVNAKYIFVCHLPTKVLSPYICENVYKNQQTEFFLVLSETCTYMCAENKFCYLLIDAYQIKCIFALYMNK